MELSVRRAKEEHMNCHQYQYKACEVATQPILNAACKEDPAKLGRDFGAINLDVVPFDSQTKRSLYDLPNFQVGNLLELTFEDNTFGTVVVGEFIEHCVEHAAQAALKEAWRVLKPGGLLILTFPLDGRPPERQHAKQFLNVVVEGETGHDITVWHQTVWTDELFEGLLEKTGPWVVEEKAELTYGFLRNQRPQGWGMKLRKPDVEEDVAPGAV